MIIYFVAFSFMGIGLLADTRSICDYLLAVDESKKTTVLVVSIISFTIMDVGLEMLQCTCNLLLDDFVHPKR